MAKRGRRPQNRGRQGKHKRQTRAAAGHRRGPGELLADVRQQLASGEPLDFLAYVSTLLAAVDPRGENPFERDQGGPDRAALPTLTESFAEVTLPETTALLAALAEVGPDELTRARARRALAARPHPLPDWLARLGEASVYRVVESTHVLGDGDNVLLGARLPGYELTAVIYIDHNLGTVVKNAFPVPSPVTDVVGRLRDAADDPDATFRDIVLADARARVAQAIEVGAITFPPFETETWPASRPLTEWLLRLMPEGGTGYIRPDGYVQLGKPDHPLADSRGIVCVHRMVLFDAIGPGKHACQWCGKAVWWILGDGPRGVGAEGALIVDHLDFDTSNNAIENLAASCNPCNASRQQLSQKL